LQQAVQLEPTIADFHSNLGLALCDAGRREEGIRQFQEAVRLDPNHAAAHTNLGLTLRGLGRQEEALGHLQQAVRIEPDSAVLHTNLGGALRTLGRQEEAIGHLQQAVRLDPKFAKAHALLGTTLYAAATNAVRAAAGQGSEKERPGEPVRADLRRQALERLRSQCELACKVRDAGLVVDWSVATWQTDPALASVRDPEALAKLPDAERAQWQRLWADVAALLAGDPLEQGRTHAARRDWAQASDAYARALKRGPTDDGHFWFEYAALSLLSGDRPGYAQACVHLVEACAKPGGPRAYHVARACTLAEGAVAEATLPGRLAESELRTSGKQFWSLTEQGALAYRAGRFQEAMPLFEQSLEANSRPGAAVVNWLWLALTQQRLGKSEEARRLLVKAQAWLDQYANGMPDRADAELGLHLHNWLEAHVLRREAEAQIPSPGPQKGTQNREGGTPPK
jgi:tetratricopeptide (TPR) repeat protein